MKTVGLFMIVRDVEKYIEDCLETIVPYVHEVVIVDTGSLDKSQEVVEACIAKLRFQGIFRWLKCGPEDFPNWFLLDSQKTWPGVDLPGTFSGLPVLADFAAARNHGWERAASDWLIWLDADDVLMNGEQLHEVITDLETRSIDTGMFPYEYDHDASGKPTLTMVRERLLRRSRETKWIGNIHENIGDLGSTKVYENMVVKHRRGRLTQLGWIDGSIKNRNLKVLLSLMTKYEGLHDSAIDPRMLFYLGQEEMGVFPDKAILDFGRYLKYSGGREERSRAHYYSGLIHEGAGRWEDAIRSYAACGVEFLSPDGLFGCARVAYLRSIAKDAPVVMWEEIVDWTRRGFAIRDKNDGPRAWQAVDAVDRYYKPYIYLSVALVWLQRWEEVIVACDEGLRWNPRDPHLRGNKEVAEKALSNLKNPGREDLITDVLKVVDEILAEGDFATMKANRLLNSLPESWMNDRRIMEAIFKTTTLISVDLEQEEQEEQTTIEPGKRLLKICIYTGPAWENWDATSLRTGIGGSETAAANMAYELARLGHDVTVLGACTEEKTVEGVRYVDHQEISRFSPDVLVVSRQPHAVKLAWKSSKINVLWAHDIHVGDADEELFKRFNTIFALTNWHKENLLNTYRFLKNETITVIRNGIDLRRFASPAVKKGNRAIFASSPDRGLERLINLWPRIKVRVPDAELHVYYGFITWKEMAKSRGNTGELYRISKFEKLLQDNLKNGVVYHGRVGQQDLADAYMASKVWTYPTSFTETYCISAIEAQAACCVPVTTNLAGLQETVRSGVALNHPVSEAGWKGYEDHFIEHVCNYFQNEYIRSKAAEQGREYASTLGWDSLALKWEEVFCNLLNKSGSENSLPPYVEE